MTEHTPVKVADLIAEARRLATLAPQMDVNGSAGRRAYGAMDKFAESLTGMADALEAVSADRDRFADALVETGEDADRYLAVIADIRREVEDFTQSDNDALCAIEHRLSRIPEHPKED